MLMMLAGFGVLWQRTLQLMLMMLAGLGFFGEDPAS